MVKVAVQTWMKYNLKNYILTVFHQLKQNTEAYHLNVEGDNTCLGTNLYQSFQKLCAKISECPDIL